MREEFLLPICLHCPEEELYLLSDSDRRSLDPSLVGDTLSPLKGHVLSLSYLSQEHAEAHMGVHDEHRHHGQDPAFIILYKYQEEGDGLLSVRFTGVERQEMHEGAYEMGALEFEEDQEEPREEASHDGQMMSILGASGFHSPFERAVVIFDGRTHVFDAHTHSFPKAAEIFSRIAYEQQRTQSPIQYFDQRAFIQQQIPRNQFRR